MMAKLSRILTPGAETNAAPANGSASSSTPSSASSQRSKPEARSSTASKMGKLRLLCRMRTLLGREIAPRKKPSPPKFEKKKSATWRRYVKKPPDAKIAKLAMEPEVVVKPQVDPIVEIRLSTETERQDRAVTYDLRTRSYNVLKNYKAALDLLTLPSRILHKDDPTLKKKKDVDDGEVKEGEGEGGEDEKVTQLLEELYGHVMSREELAALDSQPNPFNFSDRIAQTPWCNKKDRECQTNPLPSNTFSEGVGVCEIYEAYEWDQHLMDLKELEKQRQKEKNTVKVEKPTVVKTPLSVSDDAPPVVESPRAYLEKPNPFHNIPGLYGAAVIIERMLNQNQYDDIAQDFKYWEDGSDEFRPLEGSLLPLWKFNMENHRSLTVTDVCWSPTYPDLFAAAYIAGGGEGKESTGLLCLFSLKNPATPERVFPAPCGVTCIHFHPQHSNLVLAGWSDGTVVVYDVKYSSSTPRSIQSSTVTGKHILPVSQVRWVQTEPCEGLRFFSVALDGRVTKWQLTETLEPFDVLVFDTLEEKSYSSPFSGMEEIPLEGRGTCLAFSPIDSRIMLVGIDTGDVIQFCVTAPTHSLTRYSAHKAPVRDLSWNRYQKNLFISCSADWTIKIWLQFHLAPLIVLDVGGAVAGVSWTSYSSSVLVATTEEGRVHVYDLFLCKSPLCNQNIVKRRRVRMSCMAFNTSFPVVLVGGEKGHLVTLKLSPNLRQVHKDPRDLQEASAEEIEICKIERLIAVNS